MIAEAEVARTVLRVPAAAPISVSPAVGAPIGGQPAVTVGSDAMVPATMADRVPGPAPVPPAGTAPQPEARTDWPTALPTTATASVGAGTVLPAVDLAPRKAGRAETQVAPWNAVAGIGRLDVPAGQIAETPKPAMDAIPAPQALAYDNPAPARLEAPPAQQTAIRALADRYRPDRGVATTDLRHHPMPRHLGLKAPAAGAAVQGLGAAAGQIQPLAAPAPATTAFPGLGTILAAGHLVEPDPMLAMPVTPGADPLAPTGPAASAASGTPWAAGQIAAQIVQRLAGQLAARPVQTTSELALAPPELGRIAIRFEGDPATGTLILQVERPETLELMRRHQDLLHDALRDAGQGGCSVMLGGGDTGTGSAGSGSGRTGPGDPAGASAAAPLDSPASRQPRRPPASGRLDLRF